MSLPDGWRWEPYRALEEIDAPAVWAVEFLIRGPDFHGYQKAAAGLLADEDGQFRSAWRQGILCYGPKGSATPGYLRGVVEWAERDAWFHQETDGRRLVAAGLLRRGQAAITSVRNGIHGFLVFKSQDALRKYQAVRRAVHGATGVVAANLRHPQDDVMKELERQVERMRRFKKTPPTAKVPKATSRQWSRSLACWDLVQEYGFKPNEVAKDLAAVWHDEAEEPAGASDLADPVHETQVSRALRAVEPFILGRWRDLVVDTRGIPLE
jgi:hypothetical protein